MQLLSPPRGGATETRDTSLVLVNARQKKDRQETPLKTMAILPMLPADLLFCLQLLFKFQSTSDIAFAYTIKRENSH